MLKTIEYSESLNLNDFYNYARVKGYENNSNKEHK